MCADNRPQKLSFYDVVALHTNYIIPVVIAGTIMSRPFGSWLIRKLHRDPIGLKYFARLRQKYNTSIFSGFSNNGTLLGFDKTILLLDPELIQQVLKDANNEYSVAEVNRRLVSRFAPGTLIVTDNPSHYDRKFSTCPVRDELRPFVKGKLGTGTRISNHVQADEILELIDHEVKKLEQKKILKWKDFASLASDLSTQIVLGKHSNNNNEITRDRKLIRLLSKLVYTATCPVGWRSRAFGDYYKLLRIRLKERVSPGLIGEPDESKISDAQATFWLVALKDALDKNLPRILALILAHPQIYEELNRSVERTDIRRPADIDNGELSLMEGCILEALRLWTGTPLINRKLTKDGELGPYHIPAGSQVLIPASFIHRDPAIYGNEASTFNPYQWVGNNKPSMLQFSLGPMSCAGREVVLFILKGILVRLLNNNTLILRAPELGTYKQLPVSLNQFGLKVERRDRGKPTAVNNKLRGTPAETEYTPDFIVVGSGAGGGPLAANLAREGFKVALLEAGNDQSDNLVSRVPLFHTKASEHPDMSWSYFVKHYSDTVRQQMDDKYFDGQENNNDKNDAQHRSGIYYPRAGTLGGCTVHNALIFMTPDNDDWRYIQKTTGDKSWHPRNMHKYFMRLEHCDYFPWKGRLGSVLAWFSMVRHGYGGWMHNSNPIPSALIKDPDLLRIIYEAAIRGLKSKPTDEQEEDEDFRFFDVVKAVWLFAFGGFDVNNWWRLLQKKTGIVLAPLSIKDGERCSPRDLINIVRREYPENLRIITDALVTGIIWAERKNNEVPTAIGVRYCQGKNLYQASCNYDENNSEICTSKQKELIVSDHGEVILSAGTFNSPQILMLSGIGPRGKLEKYKIPVIKDLPGVGENLQDRYEIAVVSELKENLNIIKNLTADETDPDPMLIDWHIRRKGLYGTNGVAIAMTRRSRMQGLRKPPDLFIFGVPAYFEGYKPDYSKEIRRDCFSWVILKGHTKNRSGYIELKSNKPYHTPVINFRYFDDDGCDPEYRKPNPEIEWQDDLESILDGAVFAREINNDPDMASMIKKEIVPGAEYNTKEKLKDYIKNNAWGHHASGTCAMGTDPYSEDKDVARAVVDSNFKVHGVNGLRIVDASIFPKIPGLFIVGAIYIAGEKAFDVIKTAYKNKLAINLKDRI